MKNQSNINWLIKRERERERDNGITKEMEREREDKCKREWTNPQVVFSSLSSHSLIILHLHTIMHSPPPQSLT